MKTYLAVVSAALFLILAVTAVAYLLIGDLVSAGFFLFLTVTTAVVLWLACEPAEPPKEIKK